jgi:hypothetical protein
VLVSCAATEASPRGFTSANAGDTTRAASPLHEGLA